MKKFRELISRPSVTLALFALALVLLAGGTVGGARAALTIESRDYQSRVTTSSIDVALVEKNVKDGDWVAVDGKGGLFSNLLGSDSSLKMGKAYPEYLAVKNTGSIDEYVRVTVYKYWVDESGNKYPDMDSQWIKLGFKTDGDWSIDTASSTEERTVLYYAPELASQGVSEEFLQTVSIDENAARTVSQAESGNVITTTYVYNGKSFCLEVHVDGVQTHSADRAKLSAWGVNK